MLTPVQARVFRFIAAEVDRTGAAPSLGEIARHIGLASRSAAKRTVDQLVDRGVVRRLAQRERAIEVLVSPDQVERQAEAVECLRKVVALVDAGATESPAWDRTVAWARQIIVQQKDG